MARRRSWLLLVAGLAACAGMRSTPATRYQGILLDGRELGAGEVAREAAHDPTIKAYVAQHPVPDFVLVAGPRDVELVYTGRAVLAYFHRPEATAPSVVSEVTPIPTGLYQMLPANLRAGTPPAISPGGPNCWTVAVGELDCRTCCLTTQACTVDCKAAPGTKAPPLH
jgi:hypothetical protein